MFAEEEGGEEENAEEEEEAVFVYYYSLFYAIYGRIYTIMKSSFFFSSLLFLSFYIVQCFFIYALYDSYILSCPFSSSFFNFPVLVIYAANNKTSLNINNSGYSFRVALMRECLPSLSLLSGGMFDVSFIPLSRWCRLDPRREKKMRSLCGRYAALLPVFFPCVICLVYFFFCCKKKPSLFLSAFFF